MPMHSNHLRYQ